MNSYIIIYHTALLELDIPEPPETQLESQIAEYAMSTIAMLSSHFAKTPVL